MKRMLAVLLTIAMLFALCACGSKELSAEEKERIYQEVAAEKAAAEEINAHSPLPEADVAEADLFSVEEFAIDAYEEDKRLRFKVKVKNNTDMDFADLSMDYQLLDENGTSLCSKGFIAHGILAGQSCWLGSYTIEEEDFRDAKAIQFVTYHTEKNLNNTIFGEIPVFDLSEHIARFRGEDTEEAHREIFLDEPSLLYDDEMVSIRLKKIFESSENKCIEFNIANKLETPIFVWGITFYLNGQEMYDSHMQGQNDIFGGKSADRGFLIQYKKGEPLYSLEELLTGEGVMCIEIKNKEGNKITKELNIPFRYDLSSQN